MGEYILRLIILLPLVCGLVVGALWLTKKVQDRTAGLRGGARTVALEETLSLTPTTRLAVISFQGERILIALGKNGVTPLSRKADAAFSLPNEESAL
ncbi:flagellar biosynthetic protein FliO [Pacificimonas flava]|uniref:Flagellar biogenesis protein n=1 Tax=Pacificimonas flava TaxID=1234595 RepID=M2TQW3_9SPHN|nr:flagellar biosynthetic protein FliO [Pacificimonas flava]EMD84186.1 hypothetical protein C725_0116 [Pacificimonas flava]MBB5279936.1 flagellar protein FliO/FliZ [Pacificimonas flava]